MLAMESQSDRRGMVTYRKAGISEAEGTEGGQSVRCPQHIDTKDGRPDLRSYRCNRPEEYEGRQQSRIQRIQQRRHDSVSPAFDEDGYVPYEKNEGLFMEIPDARMFINLKRADGEVVRLIDYSSAGKTYTKESECAAWLER